MKIFSLLFAEVPAALILLGIERNHANGSVYQNFRFSNFVTFLVCKNVAFTRVLFNDFGCRVLFSLGHRSSWHTTGQFMNTRDNIKRTIQYISDHIDEHLSLSLLSSVAAMSECYYSHVFKLETGIGVKDYINQVRIKKAKQLLRETDLKIASVALAIGITNTNYFSVFFKRLTDKTPIEYRNLPGE